MKSTRLLLAVMALLALFVAGCSSTGTKDDDPGASVEGAGGSGTTTSGIGPGGSWSASELDNPNSPLYTKVIYFDFDQDTIRSEYLDVLSAHAGYLINSGATVIVEGHADERGSREYNVALGERRANAVKRFLEAEGVDGGQISTISYGEERPAAYGNDEGSWAENRRAVLVY